MVSIQCLKCKEIFDEEEFELTDPIVDTITKMVEFIICCPKCNTEIYAKIKLPENFIIKNG